MEGGRFEIYKRVDPKGGAGGSQSLGKAVVYVSDRPGVLAEISSMFSSHGVNITLFHYNRSEHPGKVIIEARAASDVQISRAFHDLKNRGVHDPSLITPSLELSLTDTSGILNIEVELEHRPGTLGKFATLLSTHGASVIHMEYNEDVSPTSARFAIAAEDGAEVDRLLKDINSGGWHYGLLYKGADSERMENVIGLNLVERFFFKLKDTLGTKDMESVKTMVHSSQRITQVLESFSQEAGRDLEAGNVFTSVLAFASASLARTGESFSYRKLPPLVRGGITLHAFRLPTGGNVMLLESDGELVMIDGGYGLYYEDVKKMLRENGLDPGRISALYLSHADSDHAGMSGLLGREFSIEARLHRCARRVIAEENRAAGSNTPYIELNRLFTVLTDGFTQASPPLNWRAYGTGEGLSLEGLPVIDSFEMGGADFFVLQSLGGHVPGQVFFVSPEAGMMFTSDYLLDVESLGPEERKVLSVPRFMMVSTNVDSAIFRREMEILTALALRLDGEAGPEGMIVIPGHGDYYTAGRLRR
jgi:glyoxylase-like metal-dependent hydrolase (beta-lactamase superfamily II)/glycine cleavage system regulatory protein